jgi:hypothetical protein
VNSLIGKPYRELPVTSSWDLLGLVAGLAAALGILWL